MSTPTPLTSHEALNKIVEVSDTAPVIAGAHSDGTRLMQLLEQLLIEFKLSNIYRAEGMDRDYEKDILDIKIGG